jgi:hypothetical protein
MKKIHLVGLYVLLITLLFACIPTKVAPKIDTYRVQQGSKFHKNLLDHFAFIFNDPKEAYDFYNYINTVYELNHQEVDRDVPFLVNNRPYYFSFHEAERTTNFINLAPMVVDAKLEDEGFGPYLESTYESRKGYWYIVMTVFDDFGNDALHPEHPYQKEVVDYLEELRTQYINNHNYYDVLLTKNPD